MLFVPAMEPITARRASVIARLADQRPAMTLAVPLDLLEDQHVESMWQGSANLTGRRTPAARRH